MNKLDNNKTIELLRHSVNEVSEIMLEIYKEWKDNQNTKLSDCECMAESMYQMMVCKAKNVWLMSGGITMQSEQIVCIIDPSNIYPVLRSMLEMNIIFRCIYASSINDTERELLLRIWKIRGNNNLIKIPKSELNEEEQEKQLAKVEENDELRKDIHKLMCELSLSQSVCDSIEKWIKDGDASLRGFKFEHSEQSGNITSFCALSFSDAAKDFTQTRFTYPHFSAHSHPSYLGVEHFWKMYNLKAEDNFMKEILEGALISLVRFMKDFCKYKESYRSFYVQDLSRINNFLSQLLID